MNTYFVYILTNKNNTTLYIGITNNLEKRVWQHKTKVIDESFPSRYGLMKLVYSEETEDIQTAIEREKQLKNWRRGWKNNLIELQNPYWKDLSDEWE